MSINWSAVISGAEKVATIVEELAPDAGAVGPQGAAFGALVSGAAKFVNAALQDAQAAEGVLSSNDLATVQAAADSLNQQVNTLGLQVDAS